MFCRFGVNRSRTDSQRFGILVILIDKSVGKFLYRELSKDGVNKCRFLADIPKSYVYLRKVGYKRVGDYMELEL